MKKYIVLGALAVIIVLSAVAWFFTSYKTVHFIQMENFEKIKQGSEKVTKDRSDIFQIYTAFKLAKKHHGIADMADPDYKVRVGNQSYFLWIRMDSGTIMNVENTHTTYGLTKRSAGKVYDIITEMYGDKDDLITIDEVTAALRIDGAIIKSNGQIINSPKF